MEKKTTVQLVAETRGSPAFYFNVLNGLGNKRLEYTTELRDSSPATITEAIQILFKSLRFQYPDPDNNMYLRHSFQQARQAVLAGDVCSSFTCSAGHGCDSFVVRVDVETSLQFQPDPQMQQQDRPGFQPWDMSMNKPVVQQVRTATPQGYTNYGPRPFDNVRLRPLSETYPDLTAFGHRNLGLESEEISDPAWDAEILDQVLETPHSTPAAAATALYVLDVLGQGIPTSKVIGSLPTTFVQDYNDYCTALGDEGPFGDPQLQAVKDALIKRWFMSCDAALGVLRTQLDPRGFSFDDPTDKQKLEAAVNSLLEQRALLYVNYPE